MPKPKTKSLIQEILIPGVTEYFLDKRESWLKEHAARIKAARGASSFWQSNTLYIYQNQRLQPYQLLRDLAELGYEKVQRLEAPGEFSYFGGLIRIYALVWNQIITLEFWGSRLEKISLTQPALVKLAPSSRRRLELQVQKRFLAKLEPGDFVVHLDHGIGIFKDKLQLENKTYFRLLYAQGDQLLVPESLSEKLSPYIGFGTPKIYRLGGVLWHKTKRQVHQSTINLAKKLLKIYAQRKLKTRPPYLQDDELQRQFEASFPYELTLDQEQALREIKLDMASVYPMDRLLIGDVGFGKTEIALRAAFKAIVSGKQVIMLVPTTILADQHFLNFKERFQGTPVKLGLISRVVPGALRGRSSQRLARGEIDLIIGTHGLLNPDIKFKNLGLLIIDEEQKFGVEAKETFKQRFPALDVLSLSATPIPRSLQLALTNVWNASLLLSPPPLKKKIETYLAPFQPEAAICAIEKELKRGGQVYWLYNKVRHIKRVKKSIEQLLPGIKVRIAHGQMPELELVKTLRAFGRGEFQLLLATTIIENGLDLPRVNTLIVQEAERLGLTQAHQIRGRIGRKEVPARAFFFYDKTRLTPEGQKRLALLQRFSDLGEGYELSLKDLEMRGGGNILGKEQSGHIRAVGLNLYSQMLAEAIEKLKE
jgi:transcription-repair coupling factor (superfamily II helicase)